MNIPNKITEEVTVKYVTKNTVLSVPTIQVNGIGAMNTNNASPIIQATLAYVGVKILTTLSKTWFKIYLIQASHYLMFRFEFSPSRTLIPNIRY